MYKLADAGAGGETGGGETCPNLGLEGDRSGRCPEPSPRHRCYLWMERGRIDLAHQSHFCLTDAYDDCPWLSVGETEFGLHAAILPAGWCLTRSAVARLLGWAAAIATLLWIWLRSALSRVLPFLSLLAKRAFVALCRGALRMAAAARGLAVRAGDRIRKVRGDPSLPAVAPGVEEAPVSGRDGFLAQGLAALKSGDEELAYDYFVKACKASPKNELAWYWRAKTAPTLDEVIHCLEKLLKISPGNAKAQADLEWTQQRREREQVRSEPQLHRAEARPSRAASSLRWITRALRLRLLQVGALCAFALALALAIPCVRLAGLPDRVELEYYLALLPAVGLPKLALHAPYFPTVDLGPVLPLMLGLLLLHAAFCVADGRGPGMRIWMALLAVAGGGLTLFFGTNPPAPSYAAGFAALTVVGALVGDAPEEAPERDELRWDR